MSSPLVFGLPFLLETRSIPEVLDLASELPLSFIELNSNFPISRPENLPIELLGDFQEEQGIYYTLHLDDSMDLVDFNPHVRQAYAQTMKEAIELAKKLDMPILNIHFAKGNIVTLPDGRHYMADYYWEEYEENLLTIRRACEDWIDGANITICIENTDGWDPFELRAIELFLESPVFGLCLDIGHDHACENRDLPFFEEHEDKLCHFHFHDGWDQTNHQALGTGEIPLKERLELAQKTNSDIVLETKTIDALKESVTWLKNHQYL